MTLISRLTDIDPACLAKILEEIKAEIPTKEELSKILQEFGKAQGRGGIKGVDHQLFEGLPDTQDAYLLSCASCGNRHPQRGKNSLSKVQLSDLLNTPIEYDPAEKARWEEDKQQTPLRLPFNASGDVQDYDVSKLRSAYDSTLLRDDFPPAP